MKSSILKDTKAMDCSMIMSSILNNWFILGASSRGLLHAYTNTTMQDRFSYSVSRGGDIVVCVSDGAGSCNFSHIGATLITDTIVQHLERFSKSIDEEDLKEVFILARRVLETYAMVDGCDLKDLSCTVIVGVFGPAKTLTAHIGDGAVVGRFEDEEDFVVLSPPAESEFSNVTDFITGDHWQDSLRIHVYHKPVECFLTFTDGLHKAVLKPLNKYSYTVGEGFAPRLIEKIKETLSTKRGIERVGSMVNTLLLSEHISIYSDDDKTVLIGVKK